MLVTFEKEYLKLLYSTGKSDKKHRFQPEIKLLLPLQCNVVNGCAYKVLGKDLCIKEVDVYSVLAWIISITDINNRKKYTIAKQTDRQGNSTDSQSPSL